MDEKKSSTASRPKTKYVFIKTYDRVLIKVPHKLKKVVPDHPFPDKRLNFIYEYYGNGRQLWDGDNQVILNEKFYGLPANYLGRKIIADVVIEKKITPKGREFIQLIIYKLSDDTQAKHLLKIGSQQLNGNSLQINDSNLFLCFPEIKK